MRVLLFSVTAGEGHNVTAKAIARVLTERGNEVKIVDAYRASGPFLYHVVSKGYVLASTVLKYGYGIVYGMLEHRPSDSYRLSPARISGRPLAKKFKKIIDAYDPDVVLATHPFAARILDITKERHGFRAKSAAVVTDFTMHPYWEEALRLDRVILPHEQLAPLAFKKGMTKEQLLPIGIPIHPKFDLSLSKAEARKKSGLDPDCLTLLMIASTDGSGKLARRLRAIDRLPFPLQVIVVCGKNKRAYRKVTSRKYQKRVLCLGYTNDMPLVMDAADILVSKPGGLTTSEALSRALPMIVVDPIPGQEAHNVDFLIAQGAAKKATFRSSVAQTLTEILQENRLADMTACAKSLQKPRAVYDLYDALLSLTESKADPN